MNEPSKRNEPIPARPTRQQVNVNQIFIRSFYRSNGQSHTTTEEQRKRLNKYAMFLSLFPIVFLIMTAGFFYLLLLLLKAKFSAYLLLGIFSVVLIREISTLVFSLRMRKNIIRPLEDLQKGVEEVAGGNYGFTIDEEVPTTISGLFTSFNKMSEQLREGQEIKEKYEQNRKELIAGISHDLKTPITSILGYVEAIDEGVAASEEKMQTYMDIIYKNAKYTNQLIDDLFLFSKLDINQMDYNFNTLLLEDYLTDILVEKKIDLEEQGHKVMWSLDLEDQLEFTIDAKMIYRVISNLIGNAVKYNDKDILELHIGASMDDAENKVVHVTITDNGTGIEESQLGHIFDVFYRADASRNKDIGGSGLGLSISRQLVEAHGGKIWAESTLGEGTTFHFTLRDQQ